VIVFEARDTIGGGSRTKELTLPGFKHDVCSAIHPLGIGSPFLRTLPLEQYGLEWLHSSAPLAHPFDDAPPMLLARSIDATAETLGGDAQAYKNFMEPLVAHWDTIADAFLGPLRVGALTRHPIALLPFAMPALLSASGLGHLYFQGGRARALIAGIAAHALLPLDQPPSASFGLMLAIAGHAVGWPLARGGSQAIVDALAAYLRSLGGEIVTGVEVKSINALPPSRVILCDITPRQLLRIAGEHLPNGYKRSLQHFRHGPGSFKIDYALDGPVPWKDEECLRAATVHVGGSFNEMVLSERQVAQGKHPERPYVLTVQQSLFDDTRAPAGKHTFWAYCHVPNGSTFDMTERIEAQIERFAPGFRDRILARHIMNPVQLEQYNPNYIGGDISGGLQDFLQLFTRPTIRVVPYSTPVKNLYICSSSTPPGGAVHGMCGYFAAKAAMERIW
jgi:phytoene dehydrogenase-like protein